MQKIKRFKNKIIKSLILSYMFCITLLTRAVNAFVPTSTNITAFTNAETSYGAVVPKYTFGNLLMRLILISISACGLLVINEKSKNKFKNIIRILIFILFIVFFINIILIFLTYNPNK